MFKEKQESGSLRGGGNQTIIAQGVKVEGDFHSDGDVIIDGEVSGSVQTSQTLQIGESARIHAHVIARSATIAGAVQGNILAKERLDLSATSVVQGDIETGLISVEAGAQINGCIRMGEMAEPRSAESEINEDEQDEA